MYPNTLLHIDGQWCAAASGRVIPVVNPADHKQIGTVSYAEKADLDRALDAFDRVGRKMQVIGPRAKRP